MKTKVEVNGYEITIEEKEGVITVKAEKEGDIVEEFSLDSSEEGYEDEESKGENIKSFDEFGEEEDDFEGEESGKIGKDLEEELDEEGEEEDDEEDEEDDEDDEESEDDNERTLESFQSFINKRKK